MIIRRCRMQLLVCFHQVAVTKKEKMVEAEKVLLNGNTTFPLLQPFPLRLLAPMLRGGEWCKW